MSAEPIKIELKGLDETKRILRELAAKGKKLKPLMVKIAGHMKDAVAENFENEGRPKWKPWSSKYAAWRRKRTSGKPGGPGKILQLSRQLLSSIQSKAADTSAAVGTNKKYAAVHQFGIDRAVRVGQHTRRNKHGNIYQKGKKIASGVSYVKAHSRRMKIPARPFLGITDRERRLILDDAAKYLENTK